MSRFDNVKSGQVIEIFKCRDTYLADQSDTKVNLIIGAYRNDEGKPYLLPVVQKVEQDIVSAHGYNHEYLYQLGSPAFTEAATRLVLGPDSQAIAEKRTFGVQCLSGTGALRIGSDFLLQIAKLNTIYLPVPSYTNHNLMFTNLGFEVREYRYYDNKRRAIDFDGMLDDLREAPAHSVVLLHACAHNPTGMDPNDDQWSAIANVMAERRLFPYFDCAYQGFASGDLDRDARSIRLFVDRGFELICAQSFAKNFGLYNERIGNLTIVLNSAKPMNNIISQLLPIIRVNYSCPPAHGASIVAKILNDPALCEEWKGCVKIMSNRMIQIRQQLRSALETLKTPGNWSHITDQIGMFSYTGLTAKQVRHMCDRHHIYMLSDGRMSMCGLTTRNVQYVAQAMNKAILKYP